MKSLRDSARFTSRQLAPIEVPDLSNWYPSTLVTLLSGNAATNWITRTQTALSFLQVRLCPIKELRISDFEIRICNLTGTSDAGNGASSRVSVENLGLKSDARLSSF